MTEFYITEDFPKSQIEFEKRFATEKACCDYLFKMKWPQGFVCPKCSHQAYWISSKYIYICTRCESHISLTADTIMHDTKKPITYWFKAMWWFTTRKSGVNAINLKDLLAFGSYSTAWTWLQKLRRCTIRNGREKLSGIVEVDDFVLGGPKPGKRGRGAAGKTIVLAATEKRGRQLGRIRLQITPDCSSDSLMPFIEHNIQTGSHIITDGWKGFDPIGEDSYSHQKVYWSKSVDKASVLPGVHLVASLLKRVMLGTFQGRFEPKHLQSYLDEYVFRFNRRNSKSVGKKFMRIAQQVMASIKITQNQLVQCEIPACLLAN